MQLSLVGEALAGFFPAAGGAPLVLALHAVHLAALFGLPATLPAGAKTQIVGVRSDAGGRERKSLCKNETEGRADPITKGRGD